MELRIPVRIHALFLIIQLTFLKYGTIFFLYIILTIIKAIGLITFATGFVFLNLHSFVNFRKSFQYNWSSRIFLYFLRIIIWEKNNVFYFIICSVLLFHRLNIIHPVYLIVRSLIIQLMYTWNDFILLINSFSPLLEFSSFKHHFGFFCFAPCQPVKFLTVLRSELVLSWIASLLLFQ